MKDAVELIAAAFATGVEGEEQTPRMRVSLESIYLQDPRDLMGTSRFTRSLPVVQVDNVTKPSGWINSVPVKVYTTGRLSESSTESLEVVDQSE